ncbi:MAG: PQQ-dependent sugar dehydrogenase [Gammaproteobacteria bacterium]|nr:PQQ-dependent sugar dehydrogenase [Gammaproteobacteria bacterium]
MRRFIAVLLVAAVWSARALAADYQFETVAEGLDGPWSVAFLPGGDLLVTERKGQLRRVTHDGVIGEPVRGVPPVFFAGQGGLHDVVLHPQFERNRRIYLSYAEGTADDNGTAVARALLTSAALENLEVIYRVSPRKDTPVHYGARMAFMPDGTLLITTGDGFDYREAAQDIGSGLGKVIRINDDGTPPADNPFAESPFVWSYGHRNPQGLAISTDGTVFLHEHGPRGGDEVNVVRRGANYGWPAITYGVDYNGAYVSPFHEWAGMEQPLHYWDPSIAPSGLAVYEGDMFPEWRGSLLVGALVDREVRRVAANTDSVEEESLFSELGARVRDVRVGPDGAVYLALEGQPGKVVRVTRN